MAATHFSRFVEALLGGVRRTVTFGISPIDVKLGVRMLVKNPGLTIVSTVALAIAIAIAIVAGFHTATQFMVRATLPLPDGESIVAIWQHDTLAGERGTQTLGDLQTWASELETLENVGGFRLQERGINVDGASQFLVALVAKTPCPSNEVPRCVRAGEPGSGPSRS